MSVFVCAALCPSREVLATPLSLGGQLAQALGATGLLIAGVRDEQWQAPTPCTDWTVRDLINQLVGANLVFAALLQDQTPPDRGTNHLGEDSAIAYRDSGAVVLAVRPAGDPRGDLSDPDRIRLRRG